MRSVFSLLNLYTLFFLSFCPIHSFDSPPTHSAIQVSATNFSDENDFISQFLVFSRFRWKFFFLLFFFFFHQSFSLIHDKALALCVWLIYKLSVDLYTCGAKVVIFDSVISFYCFLSRSFQFAAS